MRRLQLLAFVVPLLAALACNDATAPRPAAPQIRAPQRTLVIPSTSPQVSAGGFHTCALKTDGTVVCWGAAGAPGSIIASGQATVPAGLASVAQVSAGGFHTCALKTDGTVVCWGFNSSGQTTVPAGLASVAQVSAGDQHNCALKTDGTVVCWGNNEFGQATVPAGLASVAQVSAGGTFTCALKTEGTVVCWGNNGVGQTTVPAGLNLNVQDITPPVTTINSAVDGNGAAIASGGATLSSIIAFTFTGTDAVGVVGFQCSLDAAPYVTCSSPETYSALVVGTYTFRVSAADAAGNLSIPASFTWAVVTPAQANQNLITTITRMGLPTGVENFLLGPLKNINTFNLNAVCNKLDAFVSHVNFDVETGQLSTAAASQLLQAANAILASLGCP